MSLWVPPKVSRELQEESRRREAEATKHLLKQEWMDKFNYELGRIVEGMQIFGVPDPAPLDLVAQGGMPGYWHLAWPSYHGGPLNIQPLVVDPVTGQPRVGGEGDRAEPGSWLFDWVARNDLWSDRVVRERKRIREEAERARARRLEQERADDVADILERYKAVSRTQVSMSRGVPWSQNHAGARAAKAASKERARGDHDVGDR
jgi:hypothetical protein